MKDKNELSNHLVQRISTRNRKVGRDTIKTGVNKSTIRTYWSKLNSFFEWLLSKKLIAQNPLLGMNAPRPQFNDKREIIESDIKKLYSAITLYPPNTFVLRRDTAMISLLIWIYESCANSFVSILLLYVAILKPL